MIKLLLSFFKKKVKENTTDPRMKWTLKDMKQFQGDRVFDKITFVRSSS